MKKTEVYIVGGILAGLLLVGGVMHLRRGISETTKIPETTPHAEEIETIEIPETAPHAEETSIPKKEEIDDRQKQNEEWEIQKKRWLAGLDATNTIKLTKFATHEDPNAHVTLRGFKVPNRKGEYCLQRKYKKEGFEMYKPTKEDKIEDVTIGGTRRRNSRRRRSKCRRRSIKELR